MQAKMLEYDVILCTVMKIDSRALRDSEGEVATLVYGRGLKRGLFVTIVPYNTLSYNI